MGVGGWRWQGNIWKNAADQIGYSRVGIRESTQQPGRSGRYFQVCQHHITGVYMANFPLQARLAQILVSLNLQIPDGRYMLLVFEEYY